jgi:DNA-binding protein H-NS
MAKTWVQIQAQIARLEKQADQLKAKESADVVQRIKVAIAHYGLTADDLFGGRPAKPGRPRARGKSKPAQKKKPAAKAPSRVRFQDDAGHSWSGIGKRPNWYKEAIAAGKTPEDLAVKP